MPLSATRRAHESPDTARILLAEDDAALRSLLAARLRANGDEVTELADGGRLLVELAACMKPGGRGAPDLIVSDVRMPVMTGLEMAIAVRDVRKGTPLILMTAFPDAELARRVQLLDAHLLPKPFDIETLQRLVARCLRRA
jgi:two-component system cell cycle response regulator CpdR